MPNYFNDNLDMKFQFSRFELEFPVSVLEDDYKQSDIFDTAPSDYTEAMDYYKSALELMGDLSGNYFESRSKSNDCQGAKLVDKQVIYPQGTLESIEKLAESGLMGVLLPREFGGGNIPASIYTMMVEILSRADASLMTAFGYQDVGEAIARFGTTKQANLFLKKYCAGEHIGAMVLTEPHAGSDLQNLKLQAYQDDDGQWFLRGTKCFISNGCGDVLLVLARSEPKISNLFGLSMFACHGGDKVVVGRVEEKMGLHASPTCELHFEDAPAELIGKRKFGLMQVLHTLNHARFNVAAQALGIAEEAYQEALVWAKDRTAFGEPIYNKPAVSNMLIDMRVKIESSRSLLYKAVQNLDLKNQLEELVKQQKQNNTPDKEVAIKLSVVSKLVEMQSPMVKYHITEMANKICFDALQIHGGAGYIKESKVERLYRDVRITNIYEGTSQIQIIGASKGVHQDLLGEYFDRVFSHAYKKEIGSSIELLKSMKTIYVQYKELLLNGKNAEAKDIANKELVDIYCAIYTGCLLAEEALINERKIHILKRFVYSAYAESTKGLENIKKGTYLDLSYRDLICES